MGISPIDIDEPLCYILASKISNTSVLDFDLEVYKTVATSTSAPGGGAGQEVLEAPTCRHQWLIETPAGPSSKGVCRLCGAQGEFQNYIEGSAWGYDISLEQLSGGSRLPTARQVKDDTDEDE